MTSPRLREDGPHGAGPSGAGRAYRRGFWLVGFVFLVTMAFSAVPAPLYVLYAARDHFGPLMITVIFAAYAVGVIASLFLAGHLSDWLGRRRMAVIAVAVNVASGVIFLLWPSVPGLLIARVVSGVSVGMLTATATAYLSELDASGRGGLSRRRAEIIATAANLGGIGLGPLVSGFLAQYAAAPAGGAVPRGRGAHAGRPARAGAGARDRDAPGGPPPVPAAAGLGACAAPPGVLCGERGGRG